jgi:hypothetical protein
VNAELRGEVAYLLGLAAALDKYEHAPHDVPDRTPRPVTVGRFPDGVSHVETRIHDVSIAGTRCQTRRGERAA